MGNCCKKSEYVGSKQKAGQSSGGNDGNGGNGGYGGNDNSGSGVMNKDEINDLVKALVINEQERQLNNGYN